jgi:UDP-glucose 4-epimerase
MTGRDPTRDATRSPGRDDAEPGGDRPTDDGTRTYAKPGTLRRGRHSVLVTGAHRKMAAALISRLVDDPSVELVLAVGPGACPAPLLGHDPARFSYAAADLSKRRQVDNLFLLEVVREHRLDTVVHLAFQGNPEGYDIERHEFNVNSTRHLLDAALREGVGKFVFLSSDAVYKLGPAYDFKVREDAEINLDPDAHRTLRDTVDAEFLCRAKMDHETCEVVVLRPSGVLGGGVLSGMNLLFESRPPLLPIGFDPMVNPTSKERLARDLHLAIALHGKGIYNVAGPVAGPLSRFMEERGVVPTRIPGALLLAANRLQRRLGQTRYHAGFHPKRLYYSLVLDDARFEQTFRRHAALIERAHSPTRDETGAYPILEPVEPSE